MEYKLIDFPEKTSSLPSQDHMKKNTEIRKWEVGKIIDEKYEIQDILKQDQQKIIHKVRHCQWNIPLAVRGQLDKASQVSFFHQAERWVELGKHPNVVSAYYVQHIGGIPRLFVEYVTNVKTLEVFVTEGSYDIEMIMDIGIQIARGMDHAHKKGLLHGDLCPNNIFITDKGEVKITDFRSREGKILEYTQYMPPEQFEKDWPVKTAIDIYSFGMLLYRMSVGKLPFKTKNLNSEKNKNAFRNSLLTQPPLPPNKVNSEIPVALSDFIIQCIAVEEQQRPKSFDIIINILQNIYLKLTGFAYPREAPDPASLKSVDLNNRALSLLDLGEEVGKAEDFLKEAVKSDSECTGAVINLNLLRLRHGKASLAKFRSETEHLLDKNREVVTFYRSKISLEHGGFLEESLDELNIALKKYPENKELLQLKGLICYRLCLYNESLEIFEKLTQVDTPIKKELYYLGSSYLQLKKKKKAHEIWDRSLTIYPNSEEIIIGKAITFAMQGRLELAYNNLRRLNIDKDFWGLLHLTEITAGFGDYVNTYKKAIPHREEAQKLYDKLFEKAPNLTRVIRGYEKSFKKKIENFSPKKDEILPEWAYMKHMKGHDEGVHCIALGQNGRLVVTGGEDEYIKIWDINTGKCKNSLKAHKETISQITISYDGHFLVSIGRDNQALVWDLITGECVACLEGHVKEITSMALTSSGYLVTASLDKTLRIWDFGALSCKKILRGHNDQVNDVVVTPDGKYAISGSEDRQIGIWDIEQGNLVTFLEEHLEGVTCLAISKDGKWLASGSWDQKIRIFDLETYECTGILEGHKGTLNCITITPDSKMIVSGSEDKTIRVWNIENKKCIHTLTGHRLDVTSIDIAQSAPFIISGSWDRTIRVWHLYSGECISILEGHTDLVNVVKISSDGRFIFSGGDDSYLRMWNDLTTISPPVLKEPVLTYLLQSPPSKYADFELHRKIERLMNDANEKIKGEEFYEAIKYYREIQDIENFQHNSKVLNAIYDTASEADLAIQDIVSVWEHKVLEGHKDTITCMVIHPDNLCITGSKDSTLKIWNIKEGECITTLKGHQGPVSCVDISPNGRFVVSGGYDNSLRLWEVETGRCIYKMEGHSHWVEHVKFTNDGRRIISCSRDSNIRIWEGKTGHRLFLFDNHTDFISDIKITPDGKKLISASHDRSIKVWDLELGKCLDNLERHTEHIKCVECVPNSQMMLSGGWDSLVCLWDLERGDPIVEYIGHTSWINKALATPDGKKVISCSLDKSIRVWNLDSGQCLAVLTGHFQDINNIILTKSGRFCISSSWDNTVKIWDIETYECRKTLKGHTNKITTLASTANNRYIITGSEDNKIIVWEVDWLWE